MFTDVGGVVTDDLAFLLLQMSPSTSISSA